MVFASEMMKVVKDFTLESVLKGIHYFRCHDYIELVALVNILPQFLSQHRKVRNPTLSPQAVSFVRTMAFMSLA